MYAVYMAVLPSLIQHRSFSLTFIGAFDWLTFLQLLVSHAELPQEDLVLRGGGQTGTFKTLTALLTIEHYSTTQWSMAHLFLGGFGVFSADKT